MAEPDHLEDAGGYVLPVTATPGEFTCPVCGSSYFTTTHTGSPMIRECRGALVRTAVGRYYTGCIFSWPSTRDSWYGLRNLACVQEVRT